MSPASADRPAPGPLTLVKHGHACVELRAGELRILVDGKEVTVFGKVPVASVAFRPDEPET